MCGLVKKCSCRCLCKGGVCACVCVCGGGHPVRPVQVVGGGWCSGVVGGKGVGCGHGRVQ